MTDTAKPQAGSNRNKRSPTGSIFRQLTAVEQGEWRALIWAFVYFFSLLCSYYIVRPMRDEMGIAGGVEHLQWMFTGTFLAMLAAVPLFGWVTRRFPIRRFLPYIYYFFISNLLLFFILFNSDVTHIYVARAFFIWVSVFNLFIVSVFWSFMADIFTNVQARRLFGIIAAGGTAGALTGPALTASLVGLLGPTNLLLLSAGFLGGAVLCIHRLIIWKSFEVMAGFDSGSKNNRKPSTAYGAIAMGGGIFSGIRLVMRSPYLIGICALILLYTALATFLYFQQAQIVRDSFADPAKRTALFAVIDFSVNTLTIIIQIFLTGRIVAKIGLSGTLALIPLFLAAGFLALGMAPVLSLLLVLQVARRAGNYAIMRPAREMLYVVLDKEEKYKAKSFIDTVVYRGGDAISAWVYAGLKGVGFGLTALALMAVPLTVFWAWISFRLGKRQEAIAAAKLNTPGNE